MIATMCPDLPTLRQFLLAELPESEAEALEQHLLECDSCCQQARSFTGSDSLLEALRNEPTVAEDPEGELVADLMERFRLIRPAGEELPASDPPTDTYEGPNLAFLEPPADTAELARLGSYSLRKKLGSGGMGIVFEAEDRDLRRSVALKVMKPNLAGNPGARERFRREAQAAAGIEHEHIVTIYQVNENQGVPYLAMQLLQGESLQTRLDRLGRLPLDEVLRIGREIAEGLAAAHERGLVHRDIKPSNIWLESAQACDRGGKVKILDFGLVWTAENGRASDRFRRHPGHARLHGARAGSRRWLRSALRSVQPGLRPLPDVYRQGSLRGARRPRHPDVPGSRPTPEPRTANPEVSAELSNLIMQLLGKDPSQRPSSILAVAESPGCPGKRPDQ